MLVFETELMGIAGVPSPDVIVEKTASAASETASSVASEATEGVKEAIKSKLADAAEAAKVVIADTDGDGQEHNEL
jgi:FK506-binding protein 2